MTNLTATLTTREMFERYALENELDRCEDRSEGTEEETLWAGYINALDVEEDRGQPLSDEEFLGYVFDNFRNMGYDK